MIAYLVCCLILNRIYGKFYDGMSCHGKRSFYDQDQWIRYLKQISDDFDTTFEFKYTKKMMLSRFLFAIVVLVLMHFVSEWFYLAYVVICSIPSVLTNIGMRINIKAEKERSIYWCSDGEYLCKAHTVGMVYTLYLYIAFSIINQLW